LRATVAVPPALTDAAYTAAYNEVKTLGAFSGGARSAEQTDIANFWRQETQVPFNAIARGVAAQKGLGIEENARLFALLNIALADARIAIWDVKYLRGFWRPITAIRLGERDGNAATSGDAAWRPLLETPAHPSYVSGHSGTGAAGAAVLAALFGDKTSFSVASDTLLGKVRTFDSFSAAALENAESRIYGGIHFRFDNEQGLALGKAIGEYVVANALLPADDLGSGGVGGAEGGGAGGVPVETGSGGISLGGALGKGGHSNGGAVAHGGNDTGGVVGEAGNGGHPGEPGSGGRAPSGGVGGKPSVPGGDDDDGCSCSVPGRPLGSSAPWALVLAALVTWKRRRNRRTTG
jgi:MYXO-CTERM domain-containing protein